MDSINDLLLKIKDGQDVDPLDVYRATQNSGRLGSEQRLAALIGLSLSKYKQDVNLLNEVITAATNSATPSTLVLRDANGLIGTEILQVENLPTTDIVVTYAGQTVTLPYNGRVDSRPSWRIGGDYLEFFNNIEKWELGVNGDAALSVETSALLPWEIKEPWSLDTGITVQPVFTVDPAQTSKRVILDVQSQLYYVYDGVFRNVLTSNASNEFDIVAAMVADLTVTESATFTNSSFTFDTTSATNLRNALAGTTGRLLMAAETTAQASAALGVISRLQVTDSATRNTTTYADSVQLTPITLLAGITYDIHFFATFTCAATAGIKIRLLCSAFPSVVRMGVLTPTTPVTVANSGAALEIVATSLAFGAGQGIREARGSFRPTSNTTIVMQWATNSTPTGGDTAQILTGTFLRATPIV